MKLLKVLLPLALCFLLLAGCGKKVELAGWEDYKDHPAQDVYAGEVAAPERIDRICILLSLNACITAFFSSSFKEP